MHKLPHRIRLRPQRLRLRQQPPRFQLLPRPALRAREVNLRDYRATAAGRGPMKWGEVAVLGEAAVLELLFHQSAWVSE
jgi:hypothetical protein